MARFCKFFWWSNIWCWKWKYLRDGSNNLIFLDWVKKSCESDVCRGGLGRSRSPIAKDPSSASLSPAGQGQPQRILLSLVRGGHHYHLVHSDHQHIFINYHSCHGTWSLTQEHQMTKIVLNSHSLRQYNHKENMITIMITKKTVTMIITMMITTK